MRQAIIIFSILLTVCATVKANTTSLEPLGEFWIPNEKTRIGATERVKALSQDPYPFCFSAAAALLWDQHRCNVDKQKCSTFEQTSFLRATSAGQKLKETELNLNEGGIVSLSLFNIIEKGFVSHDVCYYNTNSSRLLIPNIEYHIQSWNRYTAPYLKRVFKKSIAKTLNEHSISITDEHLDFILTNNLKGNELAGKILLNQACFENLKKDSRFKMNIIEIIPSNKNNAYKIIENLLKNNIPVMVSFCAKGGMGKQECRDDSHAAIIVSRVRAKHKITGDVRSFYWMVNTWGETWQGKNSDGWIASDKLHQNLQGELIWLEKK